MGNFEKNWNEFTKYEVPKGLLRECNQCFFVTYKIFKKLEMIWKWHFNGKTCK